MDAIKPKYLFKFVDIATAKKIIENNSLMFSHPSTFNDPFDCNIHQLYFDFNECCDAVAKDVRAIQNQHPGRHISDEIKIAGLRGAQEDKIARCAVTCFSLNHYNTLLWSYYADKHFGACLEFDNHFEGKLMNHKDSEIAQGVIDYDNEPINYCKDKHEGIKKLFFSKSKDWAHEEEYRMSFLKKAGLYEFNKKFLKTICFGINTLDEEKSDIIRLTKKNGFSHLQFFQAYKDKLELKYKTH